MNALRHPVIQKIVFHEHLKINDNGLYYKFSGDIYKLDDKVSDGRNCLFLTNDAAKVCELLGLDFVAFEAATLEESFALLRDTKYVLNRHYQRAPVEARVFSLFVDYMKANPLPKDKPRVKITPADLDRVFPEAKVLQSIEHFNYVTTHQRDRNFIGNLFRHMTANGLDKSSFPLALTTYNNSFVTYWDATYCQMTESVDDIANYLFDKLVKNQEEV